MTSLSVTGPPKAALTWTANTVNHAVCNENGTVVNLSVASNNLTVSFPLFGALPSFQT